MQRSNTNQNFEYDNPVWVLLAELSLGDFLSVYEQRDELTAGSHFQPLCKLGMSAGYIEYISRTLANFARKASVPTKPGRLESPGRIRIFCQKKIIDDVKPVHLILQSFPAEKAMEHARIILDTNMKIIGGWGYFVIEKGGDVSTESSSRSWNSVDLYLYKEGK